MCLYVAETLHCSRNTTMTLLLTDYIPIQNKKLKKKKKKTGTIYIITTFALLFKPKTKGGIGES